MAAKRALSALTRCDIARLAVDLIIAEGARGDDVRLCRLLTVLEAFVVGGAKAATETLPVTTLAKLVAKPNQERPES